MNNDALQQALKEYDGVEINYIAALQDKGLIFENCDATNSPSSKREEYESARNVRVQRLKDKGAIVRNGGASIVYGYLSPACVECTGNKGSETFSTTFKCHRDCYFCFNKNQADYEKFFREGCPWREGLDRSQAENESLACIGLTGGEPLLNLDDSIAFLEDAKSRFPNAHLRMYTSGDLLTEDAASRLKDAGLSEIRFSVKDDDSPDMQAKVLDAIKLAKKYIPSVMVEMPIIPGAKDHMKNLLREFDKAGVDGINLLEFCFPFSNWDEFEKRGFKLKNPPFEVMYDYGYSGGLAVAGSEDLIFDLMEWAIDEGLQLGLHYCSLENKHRSEIRQKNERAKGLNPILTFDEEDFFLKCLKVFGDDVEIVKDKLQDLGCETYIEDEGEKSLAFPMQYLDDIKLVHRENGDKIDLLECYFVYEIDDDGAYFIDVALRDAYQ